MSEENIGFHDVQAVLKTMVEGFLPDVKSALVTGEWLKARQEIKVLLGPLALAPYVPSVEIAPPQMAWTWGAVRAVDGTFNSSLLLRIENVEPQKRNTYLGIFERELRYQMNQIPNLQFIIETDGVVRGTIYDSFITAGTPGEMAQGAHYAVRDAWFGRVWILKEG